MSSNLISFIIGSFIAINLIGITLMWLKLKTKIIKINDKTLNIIFIMLSVIGGFIGVLVGNEMLNYNPDSKLFKRWIPLIVFVEVCVVAYMTYNRMS